MMDQKRPALFAATSRENNNYGIMSRSECEAGKREGKGEGREKGRESGREGIQR